MTLDRTVELDIYVAGTTERTTDAIRNLSQICDDLYGSSYQIHVIDVLEDPDAAERQRIIATPTVLRRVPLPSRRVVGDLSDIDVVVHHLDLTTNR